MTGLRTSTETNYITREDIEEAKEISDHINMINWDEFDTGDQATSFAPTENFEQGELVTPEEFYSDLFEPSFKMMATISGYNTFARASQNRKASNVIYRKIASNRFTRFILMPGTQNYIDTIHLIGFIASIIYGVLAEMKTKKEAKNQKLNTTSSTNNIKKQQNEEQQKTEEEELPYVPEVA